MYYPILNPERVYFLVTRVMIDVYLCNIVQRVGNYLDQKEIMLHTNNYTLKQIDILHLFWYK